MKITRDFFGNKIEIELTEQEIFIAHRDYQHCADIEDVDVVLNEIGEEMQEDDMPMVEEMANEYRRLLDDYTMDDEVLHKPAMTAIEKVLKKYRKKRFNVTVDFFATASIIVEAGSKEEAEEKAEAIAAENGLEHIRANGSVEVDRVVSDCTEQVDDDGFSMMNNRFFTTEECPFCGYTNEVDVYNPDYAIDRKYTVCCGNCNKLMMLCDACQHAEDNPEHKCDWRIGHNCFRNPDLKRD